MSNMNPTHFLGAGMSMPNQLVTMNAAGQRVLTPMQLTAMAQAQPNLNSAYNYNLGFPTMLAANTTNMGARVPQLHLVACLAEGFPLFPSCVKSFLKVKHGTPPLNQGRGILRIMLFADYLGGEHDPTKKIDKKDIMYWTRFVTEFFTEDGTMRYTLWNSKTQEPRSFDIANSVIPRYYQVNFDSGVTGIQLILGHAREHVSPGYNGLHAGHTVDCPRATMIYSYENGTRIVATGHLRVRLTLALKIEYMDFATRKHEEYIPREAKDILPPSPVNDYGIPVKTLRSLEIAEGVAQLDDLITITLHSNQGPRSKAMFIFLNVRKFPKYDEYGKYEYDEHEHAEYDEHEHAEYAEYDIKNEPATPKLPAKPSPRISGNEEKRPAEPGPGNNKKRRNTRKASRQDSTS
ncbi:525_t:CDS:10 [Ambispora gerdemannii]|uniref:525_t:CDS:1 n=1 Tax=Ambispora gerdemannii TaxID=144530 RepID=A0A9N8YM99_9GLOM|nr:525_t:CDS:10 [Ambispora gerdemannii]